MSRMNRCVLLAVVTATGCVNLEVASQKTALENQIMGSYQKLDDDVILVSSVRSLDKSGQKKSADVSNRQELAIMAKQNQDFNRDDIDELKDAGLVGESIDGYLKHVPMADLHLKPATAEQETLAKRLLDEENKDRETIWKRVLEQNETLTEKNMPEIRATLAKSQIEKEPKGHWIEVAHDEWQQKH